MPDEVSNSSSTRPSWFGVDDTYEASHLIDQIRSSAIVIPPIIMADEPPISEPHRKVTHRMMIQIRQQCRFDQYQDEEDL